MQHFTSATGPRGENYPRKGGGAVCDELKQPKILRSYFENIIGASAPQEAGGAAAAGAAGDREL